jgi:hypothetical protein
MSTKYRISGNRNKRIMKTGGIGPTSQANPSGTFRTWIPNSAITSNPLAHHGHTVSLKRHGKWACITITNLVDIILINRGYHHESRALTCFHGNHNESRHFRTGLHMAGSASHHCHTPNALSPAPNFSLSTSKPSNSPFPNTPASVFVSVHLSHGTVQAIDRSIKLG